MPAATATRIEDALELLLVNADLFTDRFCTSQAGTEYSPAPIRHAIG
jgi:hypothetical protein